MAKNKETKKRNPWIDAICKITWPQTGKVFKYFSVCIIVIFVLTIILGIMDGALNLGFSFLYS